MQRRWALRWHPGGVHVAQDVLTATNSTRGEHLARDELPSDVTVVGISDAATVLRASCLVNRAVEDWDNGEQRILRVETLASHNDVERGVVVWPTRGVGAVRDLCGEPCHGDVAEGTKRVGAIDGDAEHVVTSGADAGGDQVGWAVGIVGGNRETY